MTRNKTFFRRLTQWYDHLLPYEFKNKHRQGSKMGMAGYLLRFTSAVVPETSHYDENFTVAKVRMIDEVLYPRYQLNSRGQTVKQIQKIPAVVGVRACVHSRTSNSNRRKFEHANARPKYEGSQEGVVACSRQSANQKQDFCKLRSKQIRRCAQSVKYSCFIEQNYKFAKTNKSATNSPEKSDPKYSTIVNTYTQSAIVNLNVVLNRV